MNKTIPMKAQEDTKEFREYGELVELLISRGMEIGDPDRAQRSIAGTVICIGWYLN
ncbi:MAG: hypothetical protein ACI8WB_002854 [Phenylobacterium sp.]|jgi:hypothetical protein